MAFTRFHDDPCRIMKQLQESTDAALYAYNVPGPGDRLPFDQDPHIRLQLWGANRASDVTSLESALRGLGTPLERPPSPVRRHPGAKNCRFSRPRRPLGLAAVGSCVRSSRRPGAGA